MSTPVQNVIDLDNKINTTIKEQKEKNAELEAKNAELQSQISKMIPKGKSENVSNGQIQNYNSSRYYIGYGKFAMTTVPWGKEYLGIKGNKFVDLATNTESTIPSNGKVSDYSATSWALVSFDKQPF